MASDISNLKRRLRRIPGVELRYTTRHMSVYYHGAKVTTLNTSQGGGRGTANALAVLRRAGVPV